MGSLEHRVAALEGAAPQAQTADVDKKNSAMVWQALAREFRGFPNGEGGASFIAMCKRMEAGHATPDDDRIMAIAIAGWFSVGSDDGQEYVLALGAVLADL